ncbi:MAG: sulfatase-like hydrolase/transferase [Planctomycetes bacterium]|nr:sulfatase-like hydrolase/transferase [Planctomycetota bacterium]
MGNTNRFFQLAVWAAFTAGSGMVLAAEPAADGRKPGTNFVIVLADDLGYGDLSCFGSKEVHTPNLDRFASEGLRFTDCYASAPNCSPSRAGLMTGRTPYRVGIHNWIPMDSPMHVRRSEITIATLLRRAGYTTCHVGKWHLNGRFNKPDQPQPSDHGFDHWFSTQNNALPCHRNPDNFVRNGQPVGRLEGFSAQLVVDEAVRWLRSIRDPRKPFFLFVCFHEPHEPIATDHRFTQLYPSRGKPSPFDPDVSSYQAHHGNITQMDDAFGRLMRTLDELGLRNNTFVFFTSDNGPAITHWHPHGSAGPLRDKKGSLYEGGIRVPGILRWPGHVRPGEVTREPICGVDLLPTLCQIAEVPVPSDRAMDGASILPVLEGRPIERTTPLYWQFNYAHSEPKVAIRMGDWKLLARLNPTPPRPGIEFRNNDMTILKTAKLEGFELYNLRDDIRETTDLAEQQPERLQRMVEVLRRKYQEVRKESPVWPAWTWPRYEGQRIRKFREELRRRAQAGR